jgi:hypothetical protein
MINPILREWGSWGTETTTVLEWLLERRGGAAKQRNTGTGRESRNGKDILSLDPDRRWSSRMDLAGPILWKIYSDRPSRFNSLKWTILHEVSSQLGPVIDPKARMRMAMFTLGQFSLFNFIFLLFTN